MRAFRCAFTPATEEVSEVRRTAAAPGAWQSRRSHERRGRGGRGRGSPAVTCHRLAQHPDLFAAAALGTTGWGGWAMWTGVWAARTFNTETTINCALAWPPARDQRFSGQVRQEEILTICMCFSSLFDHKPHSLSFKHTHTHTQGNHAYIYCISNTNIYDEHLYTEVHEIYKKKHVLYICVYTYIYALIYTYTYSK